MRLKRKPQINEWNWNAKSRKNIITIIRYNIISIVWRKRYVNQLLTNTRFKDFTVKKKIVSYVHTVYALLYITTTYYSMENMKTKDERSFKVTD